MTGPQSQPHLPVLYQQILTALQPFSPGRFIDGTVGAGGHSWGILNASGPDGKVLGCDLDPQALDLARERLSGFGDRAILVQTSYTEMLTEMHRLDWENVNGIVIDLGVSSMQIDTAARGFSFLSDGPLDMRFSPTQRVSAADLVNHLPENDLANIIWQFGEEQQSRRIARAICSARPLHGTLELAEVIRKAYAGKPGRIHPATRTFQALRIAVNEELQTIETVLPRAIEALAVGGRLAVISFHSLEDRLVKQFFRRESKDCICPPEQPVCTCGHKATIREVSRKPIEADEEEIAQNPRSRSARLRVAEKLNLA